MAVILLHGFTHTGRSWDQVAGALGESYRPLAPDIRGHGTASGRRPVSLEAVIGDVGELVGGTFTLAGYSMGGRIGLHVALAMPERVRRLILIGASPGLSDPAERDARHVADERLATEIEGLPIEELEARWAATPVLSGQRPDVRARVRQDRLRNTPSGLAAALRGLGTGALPSLWDRLGELRLPVTLVVGERDGKFRAIADEMANRIDGASVVVAAGAGHAVHLEAPETVAPLIGR